MYGQTHAGLGWVIGVLPPSTDRRLRAWCTLAAVIPDFDAGAMLFGMDAYVRLHRQPVKQRWTAMVLIALALASHLLTDMKLSGWEVYLFWPFSERGYGFQPIWALGHPLNTWLAYIFMILPWLLAFWRGVMPLELISPRLDRIFLNAFRRKPWSCATCGKPCNN